MQLTTREFKRLKVLLAWRKRPPTGGRLFPKAIALIILWCALIMAGTILATGFGSPLMFYCLGLITFLPIYAIAMIYFSVSRWRLTDAIIDWNRVEELLSSADQQRQPN